MTGPHGGGELSADEGIVGGDGGIVGGDGGDGGQRHVIEMSTD